MAQPTGEQLPEELPGGDLGLAPLRPGLHQATEYPVTSRNILPTDTQAYRKGSEFGGVGGMVQPPPHVPTAAERRMQIMAIDPTDDGTGPGGVLAPELEGDFQ